MDICAVEAIAIVPVAAARAIVAQPARRPRKADLVRARRLRVAQVDGEGALVDVVARDAVAHRPAGARARERAGDVDAQRRVVAVLAAAVAGALVVLHAVVAGLGVPCIARARTRVKVRRHRRARRARRRPGAVALGARGIARQARVAAAVGMRPRRARGETLSEVEQRHERRAPARAVRWHRPIALRAARVAQLARVVGVGERRVRRAIVDAAAVSAVRLHAAARVAVGGAAARARVAVGVARRARLAHAVHSLLTARDTRAVGGGANQVEVQGVGWVARGAVGGGDVTARARSVARSARVLSLEVLAERAAADARAADEGLTPRARVAANVGAVAARDARRVAIGARRCVRVLKPMRRASVDAEAEPRRHALVKELVVGALGARRHRSVGALAQLPSHATQLDAPVLTSMSTKVEAGHSARHSPAAVMNASVSPHVRQSVVAAPLHVSHVASQGSHAILVRFAHMNSGVHEPAHVPGPLENGNAAAHVTHSEAPGPLQVAQLAWHRWHASGCVALPPAHVHPSSIAVQFSPQPSLATRLPSSHTSLPARFPSPQTVVHASGVVSEPPEHDQPGSTVHDAEQPSPATVLLSSQPSEAKGIARRPSPHTGEHVSSPPTPEPPSASEEETQAHPTSTSHSASQPSPPTVLLSSHRSSVVRAPLPQTWITGVKSRVSSSKSSSAATVPLPAASAPAISSSLMLRHRRSPPMSLSRPRR